MEEKPLPGFWKRWWLEHTPFSYLLKHHNLIENTSRKMHKQRNRSGINSNNIMEAGEQTMSSNRFSRLTELNNHWTMRKAVCKETLKLWKKLWNPRGIRNDQFQLSPEGAAAAKGESYRCTWSPKYIDSIKL